MLLLRESGKSLGDQSLRSSSRKELLSKSDLLEIRGESAVDGREEKDVVDGREGREERRRKHVDDTVLGDDGISSLLDEEVELEDRMRVGKDLVRRLHSKSDGSSLGLEGSGNGRVVGELVGSLNGVESVIFENAAKEQRERNQLGNASERRSEDDERRTYYATILANRSRRSSSLP